MQNTKKLLVVDDSATIINALQNAVNEEYPYEVHYAKSFTEAKSLIKEHKFFASILDLELPDAAQGEVVDYALEHDIAVVVLTGTFNEELRKTILKKPIVDYIVKNSLIDVKASLMVAENLLYFRNKSVLVVDDSKLSRMQLCSILEAMKFNTIEASCAKEALETLSVLPSLDMITIDYEMPGMNGVELIQKIRSMKQVVQPLVFAVTSRDCDVTKAQFLKSGANDYFVKPPLKESINIKLANYFRIIKQQEQITTSTRLIKEYNTLLDKGSYVTKSDLEGNITFVTEKYAKLVGYSKNELIGKPHSIFRHPNAPAAIFSNLWNTIEKKKIWNGVLKNLKQDGGTFYARTTIIPVLNGSGDIVEYVAIRDDVTELVNNTTDIKRYFETDMLTNLGNRSKLVENLEEALSPQVAVININSFKEINNFYGSRIGDLTLIEFSKKLFKFYSDECFNVYRLHADEFAVLVEEKEMSSDAFIKRVKHTASYYAKNSFSIEGHDLLLKVSVGVANHNSDLLTRCDIALKHAKQSNTDVVLYTDDMMKTSEYQNNIYWKNMIKGALNTDGFIAFFQPIYDNKSFEVNKYECLIRMRVGQAIYTPSEFLEISKKSKQYFALTHCMINYCFAVFSKNNYDFSINFSVEDILDKELILYLKLKLYEYPGIQERFIIELVESEGIENYDEVERFINEIKTLGCKVAIDDFGTGYSNFEYLMKLNVDYIKIDGSLIKRIDSSEQSFAVVETIVSFAKKNAFKTVAEYVHSQGVQERVKALGIDYSQGYFIGKPSPDLM